MSDDTTQVDSKQLEAELDELARKGAEVIRGQRSRRAVERGLDEALMIAVGLLGVLLVAQMAGADISGLTMLGWAFALGALWLPLRAAAASLKAVARRPSLLEIDRQLELKDRLTTAAEFVESDDRTPFMELALADAHDHVERARKASLTTPPTEWAMTDLGKRLVASLVLLSLLALAIDDATGGLEDADTPPTNTEVSETDPEQERPIDPPTDRDPEPEDPTETPAPPKGGAPAKPGKESSPPTRDVKKSRGKTGQGKSADAASASGKGAARGTPSGQGQSTSTNKDRTKKKKKKEPKKRPDKKQETDRPRESEEQSGATTGRGAASGSNKSPAASTWSSKDQVTSDDEEDLEDDEEVDDEFDNSDARGGLQPQLRDRKPPVNRDLGIGFGNGKNPDANGRGGPSQRKKSRGVASLVLGVPIPDHIKGRPNSGKTKITQERVEPQPEDIASVGAGTRTARKAPAGHLANPELAPWMQDLVRTYFGTLRKNTRNLP